MGFHKRVLAPLQPSCPHSGSLLPLPLSISTNVGGTDPKYVVNANNTPNMKDWSHHTCQNAPSLQATWRTLRIGNYVITRSLVTEQTEGEHSVHIRCSWISNNIMRINTAGIHSYPAMTTPNRRDVSPARKTTHGSVDLITATTISTRSHVDVSMSCGTWSVDLGTATIIRTRSHVDVSMLPGGTWVRRPRHLHNHTYIVM